MGSFAKISLGQAPETTRVALEAVKLHHDHAGFDLIAQIKQLIPFRYIAISGLDLEGHHVGTGTYLVCDFPVDYMAEYYAGDFVDTDPLVARFKAGVMICRDSEAFATAEARRGGIEVLDLLRRHGITERTVVSVKNGARMLGTVSVISDKPLTDAQCILLQHFAMSLHAQAVRPIMSELNRHLKLTPGEIYCLGHAARGRTSEEIAADETYSVDTINTYLKNATRKLGAQNRTQAVAEAIRRGLLG